MRRFVAAFNAQDAEAALALVDPEFEWRPAYTGGGAVEGTVYRGHEEFRRYLDELVETWGEIEGHIDITGIGEAVVLAGPEALTLRLEDGRRLLFTLAGTDGRIVGKGLMPR